MQEIKIIIVGPPACLSSDTRSAWRNAGVDLLGPFSIETIDMDIALSASGIVIDIGEDPEAVFKLSEELEARKIPYLYALGEESVASLPGPFILNGDVADIQAIVNALLTEDDIGIRH